MPTNERVSSKRAEMIADNSPLKLERDLALDLLDCRKDRDERKNEYTAILNFLSGNQIQVSTGIDGQTTYGYGKLDPNGYWEFTVPNVVVSLVRCIESWM